MIEKSGLKEFQNNHKFNFSNKSKEQLIKKISDELKKSTNLRVNKLKQKKYRIISDLTGGFDSRIILGSLSKTDSKVDYYTFEYIQDESKVAKKIFSLFPRVGTYNKLSFKNKIKENKISEIVYKTDGLSNYFTSAICYNDVNYLYNYSNSKSIKKTARFGGLGGEFFRHPFKISYSSLLYGILNGFYNNKPSSLINLINIDKINYYKYLKNFINCNYSYSLEKNLKYFYFFEYYRIQVGLGAEDRERIHFWNVHPLWNKNLVNIFLNEIPLKWCNYDFFFQKLCLKLILDYLM